MLTFSALLDLARLVGETYEGVSTSGNATTLADTALPAIADDYFNNGTLFIRSGSKVNNALIVRDYTNTGRIFTVDTQTPILAVGQSYTVCRAQYARQDLLEAVNQALGECGYVTQYNDTVTTVTGQEEYSLPAGVVNVVKVQIASAAADPYGWEDTRAWKTAAGKLIFDSDSGPTSTGFAIRLWHNSPHAIVSADSDVISDSLAPVRLSYSAAWYACINRARVVGKDDQKLKEQTAMFSARKTELDRLFPNRNLQPLVKMRFYQ